jgi:GntR family carbon starvation induced transcriptional regulator
MQLEPSGLLSHEHQKGYRVATMSLPDFDDVRELYRELYALALRRAVQHGDQAWEERMIVTLHRTSKIPKVIEGRGEARELWQLAYKRLHGAILSGCGSPLLLTLITDLGNRLERYIETFGDMELDLKRDHHKEHGQLIELFLQRDPKRAVAAYEEFFQRNQPIRDTILEKLRKLEAVPKRGRAKTQRPEQRPEPRGRGRQKTAQRKRTGKS